MKFTSINLAFTISVLLSSLTLIIQCVQITRFVVPGIVSLRDAPVILDCDYSLQADDDDELVVKWFFGESMELVYQWIPFENMGPQALGVLKGRLDLTYKASPNRLKKYRALKITKLGPELSGNYTCALSTFHNEDTQTKQMLIFVPERRMELKYPPILYRSETDSKVLCYVEEIFPKPVIKLYFNQSETENATTRYHKRNSGLYDVEIFASADNLLDGSSICCELQIPSVNYSTRIKAVYEEVGISRADINYPSFKRYYNLSLLLLELLHSVFVIWF